MKRYKKILSLNKEGKRYRFIAHVIETEQISVLQVIKYLLSFWKWVVVAALVFAVLGIIVASKKGPESYISTSVIIPDGGAPPSPTAAEGLQDLLQPKSPMAGGLGIESFPGIMENYPFLLRLLDEQIISEKYSDYIRLGDYIAAIDNSTALTRAMSKVTSLPNRFLQLFEGVEEMTISTEGKQTPVDTLNIVTNEQKSLMKTLSNLVRVEGENAITIETEMPEAKVSTRLNNLVLEKLVEEVTRIKTAKQQRNLTLIRKQLDTARQNFEKSQEVLAAFRDANKGSNSSVVQSTLERLSSDYSLYFSIYSSLATEYELAKIELIESTPFYDVFEPAYVPEEPNNAGLNLKDIIKYLVLGIALGIVFMVTYTGLLILKLFNVKLKETNI